METENNPSAKPSQHEKSEILLATRNKHKTREIQTMLGDGVIVTDTTQHEHLPEIEETGTTFEENSKLKAEGISLHVSGIVLADDSGLEVDALGKEPGVYSARYAGPGCTDEENTALVLRKMKGFPDEVRTARFRCVLAVAENGVTLATFDGTVEGTLAHQVRGEGGFGYDPIFMPIGYKESFGELSSEIKHSMSHRSRALARFRAWWASRG
jgi:XTP/dITP diphosphohydrolase